MTVEETLTSKVTIQLHFGTNIMGIWSWGSSLWWLTQPYNMLYSSRAIYYVLDVIKWIWPWWSTRWWLTQPYNMLYSSRVIYYVSDVLQARLDRFIFSWSGPCANHNPWQDPINPVSSNICILVSFADTLLDLLYQLLDMPKQVHNWFIINLVHLHNHLLCMWVSVFNPTIMVPPAPWMFPVNFDSICISSIWCHYIMKPCAICFPGHTITFDLNPVLNTTSLLAHQGCSGNRMLDLYPVS